MPRFGPKSRMERSTLHPALQELLDVCIENGPDFTILEGYRNEEKQNEYHRLGYSKLQYPNGMHNQNPSLAVDIAPYPIRWPNKKERPKTFAKDLGRFYALIGYVRAKAEDMGIAIRCGADWDGDWEVNDQNFDDLPHIELKGE